MYLVPLLIALVSNASIDVQRTIMTSVKSMCKKPQIDSMNIIDKLSSSLPPVLNEYSGILNRVSDIFAHNYTSMTDCEDTIEGFINFNSKLINNLPIILSLDKFKSKLSHPLLLSPSSDWNLLQFQSDLLFLSSQQQMDALHSSNVLESMALSIASMTVDPSIFSNSLKLMSKFENNPHKNPSKTSRFETFVSELRSKMISFPFFSISNERLQYHSFSNYLRSVQLGDELSYSTILLPLLHRSGRESILTIQSSVMDISKILCIHNIFESSSHNYNLNIDSKINDCETVMLEKLIEKTEFYIDSYLNSLQFREITEDGIDIAHTLGQESIYNTETNHEQRKFLSVRRLKDNIEQHAQLVQERIKLLISLESLFFTTAQNTDAHAEIKLLTTIQPKEHNEKNTVKASKRNSFSADIHAGLGFALVGVLASASVAVMSRF